MTPDVSLSKELKCITHQVEYLKGVDVPVSDILSSGIIKRKNKIH